jgi:hypothetical protein
MDVQATQDDTTAETIEPSQVNDDGELSSTMSQSYLAQFKNPEVRSLESVRVSAANKV